MYKLKIWHLSALNHKPDFVLNYARRGELLDYLHKLSSFDEDCSKHYTAEIVKALEYLHGVNIVHRWGQYNATFVIYRDFCALITFRL